MAPPPGRWPWPTPSGAPGSRGAGRPRRPAPRRARAVAGRRRRSGHARVPVHRRYAVAGPGRSRRGHRAGPAAGGPARPRPLAADHAERRAGPASPGRRRVLLRGRRGRGVVRRSVRPWSAPARPWSAPAAALLVAAAVLAVFGTLFALHETAELTRRLHGAQQLAAGRLLTPALVILADGAARHRRRLRVGPDGDLGPGDRGRRARHDRTAARAARGRQRRRRARGDRATGLVRLRAADAPVRRGAARALPAAAARRLPGRPRHRAPGAGPGRGAVHDQRVHPGRADHAGAADRCRDDGPRGGDGLGYAVGSAVAGRLADWGGPTPAFAVTVGAGLLATVVATTAAPTLRAKQTATAQVRQPDLTRW